MLEIKVKQTMRFTQPVKVHRIQVTGDQAIPKGPTNTPIQLGLILRKEGTGVNDNLLTR